MHALIDLIYTVSYKIDPYHYRYRNRNQSLPIKFQLKYHNLPKMKIKH